MSETEQQTPKEQPVQVEDQPKTAEPKRKLPELSVGWWVLIGLAAFFAVWGVCAAGFTIAQMASDKTDSSDVRGTMPDFSSQRGSGMQRGDMMGPRGSFGDSSSTNDSTRLSGVVTAVDGSIITVAGNGTTTKVTTTDSTTYTGDDKPAAVNDTIMVVGTTSGDTFTATRISLQRQ